MYLTTRTYSPAEAIEILDTKNFTNRPISQFTVDRYAQEMKAGRWKLNGEPVIFGKSGRLIDGQHRLKACVQANLSFETAVVMGADDDVFDTIDDGKVRSMSDVLSIKGEVNATLLSAGLRFVWDYANGAFLGVPSARAVITGKQLMERLLEKHPQIRNSTRLYSTLSKRPGGLLLTPSLGIGLHYLFGLVDEPKADDFMTQFQAGTGLSDGSPILTLRNRLISGMRDKGTKVMTRETIYAYTVYAWNAFAEGRTLKNFSFKPSEKLPEIAGLSRDLAQSLLE